jgi:hypothetical protein
MLIALALAGCAATPAWFTPAAVYVDGSFGYDAASDSAVAYDDGGSPVPPTVRLTVASDQWFRTFQSADECTITLQAAATDALPRADWATAAGAWFGFTLPDTATVTTDCTGWDPAVWGADPAAIAPPAAWGLGIAPVDADVESQVRAAVIAGPGQDTWDQVWAPSVFGAGFHWSGAGDGFAGDYVGDGYAYVLQVDSQGALVTDASGNGIPLLASDVADGTPPSGAYQVQAWFGLEAALLRPTNL